MREAPSLPRDGRLSAGEAAAPPRGPEQMAVEVEVMKKVAIRIADIYRALPVCRALFGTLS